MQWLRSLKPDGLYQEILSEYLSSYDQLTDKPERLDRRIEALAAQPEYQEKPQHMSCFLSIKTQTALSTLVEVGDFKRFASAQQFASYLGLTPGEDSSGGDQNRLGITKAGNSHIRTLLIETAQSYTSGQIGYKSKTLKARQYNNVYQNVKQDTDYLEAATKETELSQQFKELDLSDEQRKIIMRWTDAIQAQESAYTAVVFRMGMQLCFSLLMQLFNM